MTADIVYNWKYEKLIQISSESAADYKQHHPYSIKKKSAEIISSYKNHLIIRLGALYGEGLVKGALYDLLNSNLVYADSKSEFNYISTDFISNWIFQNLDKNGLVELGACDTISLIEIANQLDLNINASGKLIKIFSSGIQPNMPSAKNVLEFAKNYQKS